MHIRKRYMHFLDKGRPKGLLGKGYWLLGKGYWVLGKGYWILGYGTMARV